ncbi:hypothetical protein [Leclercia sp.]|uniref:hypothetical protein n=1 Tax=Leclercia sp. TaxID=1898428 RepID=UPI00289B3609|nr:hypothetical protein [Leclercia sp.]
MRYALSNSASSRPSTVGARHPIESPNRRGLDRRIHHRITAQCRPTKVIEPRQIGQQYRTESNTAAII